MAGPTREIFLNQTTPAASAVFSPQRVREEQGVVMVNFVVGTGSTFSLNILGRSDALGLFYTIKTITQADVDANGNYAVVVELFPQMRFNLTALAAGGTINAWISE
jgi:hypothetical protein